VGQVLHASATTTEAVRRAIQHSQESLSALARRYGINPKTVAKWKKRTAVADLPTGPKEPKATVPCFSSAHALGAPRLPLRLAADHPASVALVLASMPATAWRRPSARHRRRQADEEAVQGLPDRLLPHRHRHHGQSVQPQRAARTRDDRGGGGGPELPPSLQPTLQSHRGCLRQAQGVAENGRRTNLGGLWDAVGRILDLFPPAECANDFSAAGYDAT
jgi:transposase-like protein